MTPDHILYLCVLAYSREAGTSGIARELGVAPSTVRRWLSGAVAIPESVPAELEKIMQRRAHEFRRMAAACDALAYPEAKGGRAKHLALTAREGVPPNRKS